MKTRLLLTILSLTCSLTQGRAQDSFRDSFGSFQRKARSEFADFRQQANLEYAKFLRQAWKTYEAGAAVPEPEDDKVTPVVIDDKKRNQPIEDCPVVIEEIPMPEPLPQPQPVSPVAPQPAPPEPEPGMTFTLYGTQMTVRATDKLRFTLASVNEADVAKTWQKLAGAAYDNLIADCLSLRSRHCLCDWAYLQMLDAMAKQFLGQTNEAELLKAFIYCQSGYQMRLATNGNRLYMLYASRFTIFYKKHWTVGNEYFYGDNIPDNSIHICDAAFPKEQALSLEINVEQQLTPDFADERAIVADDTDWMKATVQVDKNLMAFYNDYPSGYSGSNTLTRWALYANTPMNTAVKEMMYPQLRSLIKDKTEVEAVNLLCHWVQTAFVYELDNEVWGHDRAFFAEESLYYPSCDCEDRSILFTRIVRDLLGLKCALVYYPGHLAAAVAVGEEAKGDYFRIDGVKFLVADPTYIGASIGMTMRDMDNNSAKVIVLH